MRALKEPVTGVSMLITNYITTAWRNILRHKLFSIINILGLAIGLAAVMLIALYVRYETSYDSFWKNADNIYRLHIEFNRPGQERQLSFPTPPPVIEAMKEEFPEIKAFTRMSPRDRNITFGDQTFTEIISVVDKGFVDVFDFDVIAGETQNALDANNGIILNETIATKIFGAENPIGQILNIDMGEFKRDYIVNAVIKDIPDTSKLLNTAYVPIIAEDWENSGFLKGWYNRRVHAYFTLKENTNIDQLSSRFAEFINRSFPPPPFGNANLKPSSVVALSAMKISELHLNAKGFGEFKPGGSKSTVLIFSTVALLILIVATINYMNLSTARATQRAKEVSLRKVMGAKRLNLIIQFVGESILMAIIAMIIAISIVEIFLPSYRELIAIDLVMSYDIAGLTYLLLFTIGLGLLGGLYPAFILSNFQPSTVLKSNKSSQDAASPKLRSFLVMFQFCISIILFVSTAVIYNQMNHIKNIDLGFNKENLVTLYSVPFGKIDSKLDTLRSRLPQLENVSSMTWTLNFKPGLEGSPIQAIRTDQPSSNEGIMMSSRGVGYDFFKTWDIPIIAGRTFDRNRNDEQGGDRIASMILTEVAAERLGLGSPEEAIGKSTYLNEGQDRFEVIGVAKNIRLHNFKETSEQPEFFYLTPRNPYAINLRYTGDPMFLIDKVSEIWQQELPDAILYYEFAVDAIAEQYSSEQNQMTMFAAFSGLAIFIACLGLFGLASFTAERRTKEIGIRKVFGAEVWQIVKLLVWQFSKPVLIANIIAWPVAYIAMSRWLESFVFRIDDMVIIALCLLAGLTALLIAWATVAGNSYAVARQNPIKALRYE